VNPSDPLRVLAAPGHHGQFGPTSAYAEAVWLPVIGPASWHTWRVLARGALLHEAGWTTSLEELSAKVGLGSPHGNQSGIARAMRRLSRFGIVRDVGADVVVVRCHLGFVSPGQLDRLPPVIRAVHYRFHDKCAMARAG
jgi:hypothetical protein